MKKKSKFLFNTDSVHAGEKRDSQTGSVNTPIYLTDAFSFDTVEAQKEAVADRKARYLYSRWGNPTVDAVARKMSILENGDDALVFASGMSAITSILFHFLELGDHIIAIEDCYGGTLSLFNNILPRFGITTTLVPTGDLESINAAIKAENTKMVYIETPTNPLLAIQPLRETVNIAHENDCLAVCDNTFATPMNQNPLNYGFDLVCHSATKYLGGHNDLTAGVIVGSQDIIDQIWPTAITLGGTLNANTAWLLLRGLKTLGLRVQQCNQNALEIAHFLEDHHKIRKVFYPGLPNHLQHKIAKHQMQGFGGVLSFEIDGSFEQTVNFLENVEIFEFAASLGGVQSLITQPAATSHSYLSPEERARLGISDSLIRMSVGIEDVVDLKNALNVALENLI
ncbi:MAG: trans-sulfuration enzyme family protein [Candidatus Hodarchaeota archaeon]